MEYNIQIVPKKRKFNRKEVGRDAEYIYLFAENGDRTSKDGLTTISMYKASWYEDKYGMFNIPRKGQARIRGVHNAYPVTTLRNKEYDQWSDKLLDAYKDTIDDDINQIKEAYQSGPYKGIKLLELEFGNDTLSRMKYVAPDCYKYLTKKLSEIGIDNSKLQAFR